MKIKLNLHRTAMENAQAYFDQAKKYKQKQEGVKVAMVEMQARIDKLRKEAEKEQIEIDAKQKLTKKRDKQWFEKFHYFYTSQTQILVVAGKDAKQNDQLFSKYLHGKNLFFHAHIKGAPATILLQDEAQKEADELEMLEVATFAASFSSAWKNQYATIDVYSMKSDQVSKYESGGFVGAGGFALKGERQWFKDTKLQLFVSLNEITRQPAITPYELKNSVRIKPGSQKRTEVAKTICKRLKIDKKAEKETVEEIIQLLPGECEIGK